MRKYRFSAFVQGASDLPQRLRAQGYDTVLITGTVTNVCCESSARDAMMLNFKTIMVSDANAARTDEEHNATLGSFYAIFGDVMDTDFLIERLEANAALPGRGGVGVQRHPRAPVTWSPPPRSRPRP